MRKALVGLLAVLLLVALAAVACRGRLAMRVMRAGADRALAADPIAELPDGLHLALCGAGSPLSDPQRSGPCVAVVAGDALFVVDAGSGGARNLQGLLGWNPGRIHALFLTHFHSDHIDGLGELGMLRWAAGSHAEPLPVVGPDGVERVTAGFNVAYRFDAGYRVAHHGEEVVPAQGAGLEARPFPLPEPGASHVVWERDGAVVRAIRVDHEPVSPAVAYRFDYGGRSLVVSGDTVKSEDLVAHARGVDLLVHEALAPQLVAILHDAAEAAGRAALAKITADIPDYHTTPVEAAELAEAAGAGHLLFYHVVPPLRVPGLEAAFVDGVSDAYSGDFTVGRDGTAVSLPSGSDAIDVTR